MDIIESITGKLNINLGDMNNPNIIIEGIKVDNSEDSSEDDEDEEEEEDDEDEEEEEDDDEEEEEEEDDEEENENNNQNNSQNNNESDNDDSNEENNEEDNNELQTFKLKKKKFILNLNEFQYKHIKKYSKNKEKKCSICLVKYQKPDILKEFPCNHIYHKNCILKWLEKSNICPLCKYDITNDVNKIELKNSNEEENNEEEDDEEEEEEEDDD
jgi:archaellum component FlaD/FlaE